MVVADVDAMWMLVMAAAFLPAMMVHGGRFEKLEMLDAVETDDNPSDIDADDARYGAVDCDDGPDRQWHVFVDHFPLPLKFLDADHTELLFCYLTKAERLALGLPSKAKGRYGTEVRKDLWYSGIIKDDDAIIRSAEKNASSPKNRQCIGAAFETGGVTGVYKQLGDSRMVGAVGNCKKTKKYFKGCVNKWTSRKFGMKPQSVAIPGYDSGWIMEMLNDMAGCQSNWNSTDYTGFSLFSYSNQHNCNAFTAHILDCKLNLGFHIVPMYSKRISNGGNRASHTCECQHVTKKWTYGWRDMTSPDGNEISDWCTSNMITKSISASSSGSR